MKIKIMNYNILHGFHQINAPFALEEKRLKAAQEIVSQENPDILVLTEAKYGRKNIYGIKMDYVKIFGYPHSYFSPNEYEYGNMILSKFPIAGKTIPLSKRTGLKAQINLNGKILNIDVFHSYPDLTEDEKIESIKPLLNEIKENYILTGDFNSLSDEDYYDREELIKGFSKFDKSPEARADRFLERKLIPYIKSHGLKDAFSPKTRTFTLPTSTYGYGASKKEAAMRIDYFFISSKINVLKTKVIKNYLTEKASDHYPIIGVFEL